MRFLGINDLQARIDRENAALARGDEIIVEETVVIEDDWEESEEWEESWEESSCY